MKFLGMVGSGPVKKQLNCDNDPDHHLDTGIVFGIREDWEIRKVVNGHKSAAHTDSPDGGTGKTCLGGGMHCPSAFSCVVAKRLNGSSCFFGVRVNSPPRTATITSRQSVEPIT